MQANVEIKNLDEPISLLDGLPNDAGELRQKLAAQEKLAFIGQLTAGILHEIKNPLNFVNNFSRISIELLGELKDTIQTSAAAISGDAKDDIEDIITNLSSNIGKILDNGSRAERIILNMLAQARENDMVKFTVTDVNQLVDDFTKLGYQGMRGTTKDFNLALHTNYDAEIGKVAVDAPDLGRVILNIVNNACYALDQKKKNLGDKFHPEISISTKKLSDAFAIHIKDNGTGISGQVLEKLFQPFFTTKPVGDGTGLGLAMSNDIVTNIHKGTLEVNSEFGEYAEFVITIPTNLNIK